MADWIPDTQSDWIPDVAPKKKQGFLSNLLSMPEEALGEAQTIRPDTAAAAGEAGLALGTGAVSWIPAGLQMFSGVMGGADDRSLTERAQDAKDIQASLTYEPRGEAGAKLARTAAYPLEWMAEKGNESGQMWDERGYPILGAVSRFGGEAAPFLVPSLVKGAKAGGRAVKKAVDFRALEGVLDAADTPTLRPGKVRPEAEPTMRKPAEAAPEEVKPDVFDRIIEKEVPEPPKADVFDRIETKTIGDRTVKVEPPTLPMEEGAAQGPPKKAVAAKSPGAELADAMTDTPVYQAILEIKRQGGLNYEGLAKVYGADRVKSMVKEHPGLISKEGGAMYDRIADEYGFESPDALINAIMDKKSKKQIAAEANAEFNAVHGEDIALAKKGFTKTDGIYAESLEKGDKIFMNDDTFKVTGYDEKGNVILKDGETIVASPSDKLQATGIKRKPLKEETATMEGMSERETFGLTNPETEIGVLKPKENLSKTEDIFTSGVDPAQIGPVLKSLKEKAADTMVGKAARGLGQEIHSPEVVLSREPAGKIIYETADRADVAKNTFLSKEGKEYETRMKEASVKPDTEASAKVGQALDGKIDPAALSPNERSAYDFFKQKFHFLIQEAGKAAAGDQATYVQALNLANRKVKPMEQVKDLSAGQRTHYKGLKTPEEKAAYLHEKWKEAQPESLVKSYDILSRELKNYLPHIFDKETLVDMFKTEAADVANKLRTATNEQSINQFKSRLGELEAAIQTVQGGGFVKYEALPRNVRFKFFENRKGKEGYQFDAAKAYQTYLVGIARKMFDEPAMKAMAAEYNNLSPELKPYAEWYMRRFSGTLKKNRPLDDFANAVASFQWIRTLGFNPRSAMVNLSQRLNTVAEVGVKYSAKGERYAFTDEGKALFDSTGLAKEVPQVLYEGGAPSMEKLRSVAGWMFNKVELGNRRHAFLSAYLEATEGRKMAPDAAVKHAENIVHKTQFRYGRVGMPKIMSSPAGRVGLQFMSYPIKQIELLTDWAKHDPMKLVKYLAMAEGINYTLQEFLDTDMSNAIGIGMNMGEAMNVLKDASKGDLREAWRHARLALQPGSGLLPSGFGPTATGAGKIISAIPEGKAGATLVNELTPAMARRGIQAVKAVQGERDGKYPIVSASGRPSAQLTAGELIQRTIGPRTETEHQASLDYERKAGLERQRQEIQREIIDKFIKGDVSGARALAREHKIIPTMKQIEDERLKRRFTREEIAKTKSKPTKAQIYQIQKEGRVYY